MSNTDQGVASSEMTEFVCYGLLGASKAPPQAVPDDDSALTEFIVVAPVWRNGTTCMPAAPAKETDR
jgi:hypothetical protein